MRIALTHDMPPGGGYRHMVETTVRSATQHEYVLFTTEPVDRIDPRLAGAVAAVETVEAPDPDDARIEQLHAHWRSQRRIAEAIEAERFDLAVLHPSQVTQAPLALTGLRTTPTVYIAHEVRRRSYERGYQPWIDGGNRAVRVLRRTARAPIDRVLRRADRRAVAAAEVMVANSSYTVDAIGRAYGRAAVCCHPGADLDRFSVGDAPRAGVLSVGALDPTKGHDLVVEALGRLPAERRPALTIVFERHDPRFERQLVAAADRRGVDLTLERGISDTRLAALYRSTAVTACASRGEPFGLTVLESIASGTPVVAVREGGFRESVVPGRNGELVDRDPAAFAHGLELVLSRAAALDPHAVRATLVPYWTWDRTVEDLHRVFVDTVAS
jgi:glycosyltransferase involved in cell wall biosynthesis